MTEGRDWRICTAVGLLAVAAAVRPARGEETAAGFLALATDYLYHGLSQSQGNPTALLDGHVRNEDNLFAGVTLASVQLNHGPSAPLEVGVYGGGVRDLSADWSAQGTLAHYFYPGNPPDLSYAYTEAAVGLEWR